MKRPLFVLGLPGPMGGASVELWHTLRLWQANGIDARVLSLPNGRDTVWERRVVGLGFPAYRLADYDLRSVPELSGAVVIHFCNWGAPYLLPTLREMGCSVVWVNTMTWLFDHERDAFQKYGLPDHFVFQSEFQASRIEAEVGTFASGMPPSTVVRAAFDTALFPFRPPSRRSGLPLELGWMARPDPWKWLPLPWPLYRDIAAKVNAHFRIMGWDHHLTCLHGPPPVWVSTLPPLAVPSGAFLSMCHVLLPMNDFPENWPRTGLEAMATGTVVVAPRRYGWPEMIEHGVSGFLANDQSEAVALVCEIANHDEFRTHIAVTARRRLETELADPRAVMSRWGEVFDSL